MSKRSAVGVVVLSACFLGCAAADSQPDADESAGESPEVTAHTEQGLIAQGNGFSPTVYGFATVQHATSQSFVGARCTATIVNATWLATSKTCTSKRIPTPSSTQPAVAADLRVNHVANVAEIIWHPNATVNFALIRLQQPLAGTTNREFYRGRAQDFVGYRLHCFGFKPSMYEELHRGSFVVTNPRTSVHDLVDGRSTDPAYSPPNYAFIEASDSGGACVTADRQIVSILQDEDFYDPMRKMYVAVATSVEAFAEWALDTMRLVDNRRLRQPATLRAAGTSNCMDLPYGTSVEGGPVNQFSCHSAINQRFFQEPVPTGGFRIVSAATGKCLEATSYLGGVVVQKSCEERRSGQVFDIFAFGSGAGIRPRFDPLGLSCVHVVAGAAQLRVTSCPAPPASPYWILATP